MTSWRGTDGYLHVELADGRKLSLEIEEFHPYEPAAYVNEAGYSAFDGDTEYFVSTYGVVWQQPENNEVGICPLLKQDADKREREIARAVEHDAQVFPGMRQVEPNPECGICFPDGEPTPFCPVHAKARNA